MGKGKLERRRQAADSPKVADERRKPAPAARAARIDVGLDQIGWPDALLAVAVAALAVVLYLPSLDGPFVFDDPNAVAQSALVRSLTPLSRFVTLSTRPLSDFSYALDYAQRGLATRAYHRTNIALHAVNTALLFALAWLTLSTPAMAERYRAGRRWIALAAAAAFAAHPLATETVSYVSSRSEALVGVFILLTVIVYVLAIARRSRTLVVLLPFTTAAALGSKEIAITLPLALVAYDWCFLARGEWRETLARWRPIALSALPLAFGALFLLWRSTRPTGLGDYGATAGLGFDRFTRWQYLITEFGVLVRYLRLVVVPTGLTFDYDWPLQTTFFSLDVFLPLLALAALGTVAVRSVRSIPALAFAVLWMFVILAPTSSFVPIADIAVERRMYLPIAGWALLGATALWDLSKRAGSAAALAVFLVLAALPLAAWSVATYERAALWADAIALHEDGVAKAPGNPRVRLNLGVTYLNLHQLPNARRELAEAKRLYDLGQSVHCFRRIGAFIHYNLGAVLYMSNQPDQAVAQLQRSIELGGEFLALRPMAYYLLARIAVQHEDFDSAEKQYEEALKYNKDNAGWFVELAGVYLKNNKPLRAQNALNDGLRLHPGNPELVKASEHLKAPPAQQPKAPRPKPAPAPPASGN